jgi:hypothetical protein
VYASTFFSAAPFETSRRASATGSSLRATRCRKCARPKCVTFLSARRKTARTIAGKGPDEALVIGDRIDVGVRALIVHRYVALR